MVIETPTTSLSLFKRVFRREMFFKVMQSKLPMLKLIPASSYFLVFASVSATSKYCIAASGNSLVVMRSMDFWKYLLRRPIRIRNKFSVATR